MHSSRTAALLSFAALLGSAPTVLAGDQSFRVDTSALAQCEQQLQTCAVAGVVGADLALTADLHAQPPLHGDGPQAGFGFGAAYAGGVGVGFSWSCTLRDPDKQVTCPLVVAANPKVQVTCPPYARGASFTGR